VLRCKVGEWRQDYSRGPLVSDSEPHTECRKDRCPNDSIGRFSPSISLWLTPAAVRCYPALVWEFLKRAQIPLTVASVIALVYLAYVFLARRTAEEHYEERQQRAQPTDAQKSKFNQTYGGAAVKIMQFYARDPQLAPGQSTLVCYGVVNAKSVRVDPPIGDIYPALNRCLEVAPKRDTKYIITAEGNDGKTETAEFTLSVGARGR